MDIRACAGMLLLIAATAFGQRTVTFPPLHTSEQIQADVYGMGKNGVVLAHGGRFHKESWRPQAEMLAQKGFLVLALAFRRDHLNPDGSPGTSGTEEENADDVLAAVRYLKQAGAQSVSAVGGSLGGDAVGTASARSNPGTIARLVFLGSTGGWMPEKVTGRKLIIFAREDKSGSGLRLPEITEHYRRMHEPKQMIVLEGSAHAQFLFQTEQGPRVMEEIVRFLSAP